MECIAIACGTNGGQYIDYVYQQQSHFFIIWLTSPKIVDTLLMLIIEWGTEGVTFSFA